MSMSNKNFRIAICGGGLGGLTLAVTIGRFSDVPVDLYEAAPQISTIGAGIALWKRTWRIFRHLGLDDGLAALSILPPTDTPRPGFAFRRSDQTGEGIQFYRMMVPYGSTTLHRADVIDLLKHNLPPSCTVHTSKRLLHYTESGAEGITLHFADGTKARTDVFVGADGIRSPTRETLFRAVHAESCTEGECICKAATPVWSGTLAYRCLISVEELERAHPGHRATSVPTMAVVYRLEHIICYPISQGRELNFIGFRTVPDGEGAVYGEPWVQESTVEEVRQMFEGWEPEVQQLLDCIRPPSKWAIHVIHELPFSTRGRIALMGDAVHAMTTHQGSGAGEAISDAYILGRLLAHPLTTLARVPEVLKLYESARLPFAAAVLRRSRLTGLLYEFSAPGGYDGAGRENERAHLEGVARDIYAQWEWQWEGDGDEVWEGVEERLRVIVAEEGVA
ncbi:FAD/NAD(P)-binding domain-containing protein [Obba rivulosa]|uniref:FAD/NAD(P)-binding domain-containing protein n=1 Tax=Obba rivulosa TaxID=1052685 RepID=A0A8E2DJZ2_9APHY|nr:FAD/NAD(P)-binding domain-containing protein [Obba rivulosa]